MRFILHSNWKHILRDAWSMRLWAIAVILQGIEVILPMFAVAVPTTLLAVLTVLAMIGGMYARLVLQPKLTK